MTDNTVLATDNHPQLDQGAQNRTALGALLLDADDYYDDDDDDKYDGHFNPFIDYRWVAKEKIKELKDKLAQLDEVLNKLGQ
jgi:hypothetical protein